MSRLLFRGEPLPVVSAECFAPLPDSGHRECSGRTGSGAPCVCACHSSSAAPTFRVVRVSATERTVQTCGSCSHWDKTWGHAGEGHRESIEQYKDGEMRPLPGEWGDCQRILHLGTGGGHGAPFVDSGVEVTVAAFLSDGSGYYASLSTRSDFGCTLWEARP